MFTETELQTVLFLHVSFKKKSLSSLVFSPQETSILSIISDPISWTSFMLKGVPVRRWLDLLTDLEQGPFFWEDPDDTLVDNHWGEQLTQKLYVLS